MHRLAIAAVEVTDNENALLDSQSQPVMGQTHVIRRIVTGIDGGATQNATDGQGQNGEGQQIEMSLHVLLLLLCSQTKDKWRVAGDVTGADGGSNEECN